MGGKRKEQNERKKYANERNPQLKRNEKVSQIKTAVRHRIPVKVPIL